jgi:hypothetical protein
MSSKIIQLEFAFQTPKNFEDVTRRSMKALFHGHNEIVKANKEIKSFHDLLMYQILDTQDALLAISDRLERMENTHFTEKTPQTIHGEPKEVNFVLLDALTI